MTDFKKIIDGELESMTFNDVKNRRSIKMRKNFKIKKITVTAAAVIAAAMALAISTSAMGLWSISELINRVFPERNDEIQPYAFSSEIDGSSAEQFKLSTGNFICDGNVLVTEFLINQSTQDEFKDVFIDDRLIFPDIPGADGEVISGGAYYQTSDDGLTLIITRVYSNLPRKITAGDKLQIKIEEAEKFAINPDGSSGECRIIDDRTVVFSFTVPEMPDPIPLAFKNENGEKVFDAELTTLSLTTTVDEPVFVPDDISDYDAAKWVTSTINVPKFYDENMNIIDSTYSGNSAFDCIRTFSRQNASILFNHDPKIDEARYIKWFDCIAEIPQNE